MIVSFCYRQTLMLPEQFERCYNDQILSTLSKFYCCAAVKPSEPQRALKQKSSLDSPVIVYFVFRLPVRAPGSAGGTGGAARGGEESASPAAKQRAGEQCPQTTGAPQAAGAEAGRRLSSDSLPLRPHCQPSEGKLLQAAAAAR